MRWADRVAGTLPIYQRIICVSNGVKDSFARYPARYRRKLSVVHNGINWPGFAESRTEARASFGVAEKTFLIVTLGRLEKQKNYGFLLEVLAGVADVRLMIAGSGSLLGDLQATATALGVKDRVEFLGNLDRAGVIRLLRAADCFVQTSLFEGQSNAVLEAMHAGLPIVVSDLPEQRETVIDEETRADGGLIVPLDDLAGWRLALVRISHDAEFRAQLAANAKMMVNRRFTLERMVEGFEAALTHDLDANSIA
jgi:glycosyltransferase involved in cell wall biosynthesis